MKTATVRQLRHRFGSVLEWVEDGEQVEIKKRGKIVALLSPPVAKTRKTRKRNDLAARLKLRDGNRVISARVMDQILSDGKGRY